MADIDWMGVFGLPERMRLAGAIVTDLVLDVEDRRGLKAEWEAIDPEIRNEIVHTWCMIVLKHLGGERGSIILREDPVDKKKPEERTSHG